MAATQYYLDAHRPTPSRAAAALDVERRAAAERAHEASAEARSRVLDRSAFTLGRVGTVEGRELELVAAEGMVGIMDPARTFPGKFVCGFTFGQANKFVDMLARALEGVNDPTVGGEVGVVRAIERALIVERATGQVVVREILRASDRLPVNGEMSKSASTLFSMNHAPR